MVDNLKQEINKIINDIDDLEVLSHISDKIKLIINDQIKRSHIKYKNVKFVEQQKEILKKIFEIIGISDQCKVFYTYNISNDETKTKILNLTNDIKLFYKTTNWSVFKLSEDSDNYHLALIRAVLKYHKIDYTCSTGKIKDKNNNSINTKVYNLDI